ncbi:hypothetical protein LIER_35130 [Lithospermum erythrorhizon]|uniref:Uncharacterized protein n=1 Tax=Lithospermum erythrorhizon TaxID=34254 RepID=A0AAV3NLQ5_LITER
MRAEVEGMQAERDFALLEKDTLKKEGESFRTGRDEMLETYDHLLDQLTESQRQAQIMEASLEGVWTTEGLGELVRSSDARRDLLFQHFSLALERTIQAVQARLEEAELEVPHTLWDSMRDDSMRDDVSSPDFSNL